MNCASNLAGKIKLAALLLALIATVIISICPLSFGLGPRWTVYGPVLEIGYSQSWHTLLQFWLIAVAILIFSLTVVPVRSCNLQALTCTRNC
jgi:heme/copper-type cytochrome/quinol oxidase subunit 1